MERRRLGRTGQMSSVVTFGTAGIGRVSQEVADEAVETVLRFGVNHFDVAPSYGEAELRLGPWMPRIRDQIFLGCKTLQRGRDDAKAELHRSLERLQTDRLDLYQLHSVGKVADLDLCTAPGGAVEALVQARDEGLVRWLGITGHTHDAPRTHLEALRRFDFDTVMLPLNFVLWSDPDYRRDFEALLEVCLDRDVGIHILKAVAKDPWGERTQTLNTWYEPFTRQEQIDPAVAFVLSQPIATLCSPGDHRILPRVLLAAERFQPLDAAAQQALLSLAGQFHSPFVGIWA